MEEGAAAPSTAATGMRSSRSLSLVVMAMEDFSAPMKRRRLRSENAKRKTQNLFSENSETLLSLLCPSESSKPQFTFGLRFLFLFIYLYFIFLKYFLILSVFFEYSNLTLCMPVTLSSN